MHVHMRMKIVVTCGPSYEPIDEVRRITNFSTGELGILLSNRLARAGHEVLCFKGVGAVCPLEVTAARVIPFTTNDHLQGLLHRTAEESRPGAVFHTAALSDFKVAKVSTSDERPLDSPKISSRQGAIRLTLEPARKLIAGLRALFPHALIVGWKYELNGARDAAISQA